jgi:hypothetical protein
MVFVELMTLSLENITLEDYLTKHKSLIERIDKSGIKLTSKKQSLLVIIMGFSKLSSHEAIAEVWIATKGMTLECSVRRIRRTAINMTKLRRRLVVEAVHYMAKERPAVRSTIRTIIRITTR